MCKFGLCHVGPGRLEPCKSGYIYIAQYENTCKIGCTTEDNRFSGIKQRLKKLRSKTEKDFQLVYVLYFSGCIKGLELAIHKEFRDKQIGKDKIFNDANTVIPQIKQYKSFVDVEIVHIAPEDLCHAE